MSKAPERSAGPRYTLDRITAVPALVGNADDYLVVTGLAGTAKDMAAMTKDGATFYGLAGGELLMNVGSLATVSVLNPPNLRILCVDNGHYGETGYQKSHTCLGVDLEQMAVGAGIKATCSVEKEADFAKGAKMLRESNGSCFVLLRVKPTDGPKFKRNLDPAAKRVQFRLGTLGEL
jgi:thiamine pyrophosphate-dependent acetolactate synthase large subunit-like protein